MVISRRESLEACAGPVRGHARCGVTSARGEAMGPRTVPAQTPRGPPTGRGPTPRAEPTRRASTGGPHGMELASTMHPGRGMDIGRTCWVIAEGYIPSSSHGAGPAFESHETACLLNTGTREARVELQIYYADREPVGPYRLTVPAQRTLHLRFNELSEPEPIPRGTDYACVITSDVPIVVQHTRLDSRQAELALMSTMAYPA